MSKEQNQHKWYGFSYPNGGDPTNLMRPAQTTGGWYRTAAERDSVANQMFSSGYKKMFLLEVTGVMQLKPVPVEIEQFGLDAAPILKTGPVYVPEVPMTKKQQKKLAWRGKASASNAIPPR